MAAISRPSSRPALPEEHVDGWLGLVLGLLLLVFLAGLDAVWGKQHNLEGSLVIVPFVTALVGNVRQTIVVAVITAITVLLAPVYNSDWGAVEHYVRAIIVFAGGVFAVIGADARMRVLASRHRFAILAAAAEVGDAALSLEETVDRLSELLVPAVGDVAIFDLARRAGGPVRAGVRSAGGDAPDVESLLVRRDALPVGEADEAVLQTELDDDLRSLGMTSALRMPLRARGRTFGMLSLMVGSASSRTYDAEDLAFVEVLTGRCALALDNVGLFSELQAVEAQLGAAMGSLAEAVTMQDATGALVYANDAAAQALGFDSADELLATPPGEIIDAYESFTEDGAPLRVEDIPGRRVLRGEAATPLVLRAVNRATGEERWRVTKSTAVRDPQGRVRFVVNVIDDITEVKHAELAQRLLARAGEVLASSLDYEQTLGQVAQLAVPQLADWCGVSMPDHHGGIRQVAVAHVDPAKVRFARSYAERYPERMDAPAGTASVMRDGHSELVSEVTDEMLEQTMGDPEQLALLRSVGMRSVIIVPMTTPAGDPIGAITFVTAESSRAFTQADLELAEELGRRAGTAVENARLYTERSRIARTLQTSLLPPELPDVPGFELAALYRPAGQENWVGGDFYDAFEVQGGWMVLVGDVAGRGADAAALTALARHNLRTAGRLLGDPARAVEQLNRELLARSAMSLCTVACALLQVQEDEMRATIVCCGHPLPYLVRGGTARAVGKWGAMLGAWVGETWDTETVVLEPGDVLVFYTDGVIDAQGAHDRFGDDRLQETLTGATDADDAINRIRAALNRFEAGDQADDTAALALVRVRAPVGSEPADAAPGMAPGEAGSA